MAKWTDTNKGLAPGWTPYADWDRVTSKAEDKALSWHPVYVQLREPWEKTAEAVLKELGNANGDPFVAVDDVALRRLRALATETDALVPPEDLHALSYLVLYIRVTGDTVPVGPPEGGTAWWRVIRVGPLTPLAKVVQFNPERGAPTARESRDLAIVLTGILDDGIGVMHERLRDGSGTGTRVVALWRQAMAAMAPDGSVAVGAVYDKARLEHWYRDEGGDEAALYRRIETDAVKTGDPATLVIPDQRLTMTHRATHGTFVADLAAGYDPGTAPDTRPIAAVELPPLAVAETWGARLEFFLLQGLMWLIDQADTFVVDGNKTRVPLVVTLSYGASAGRKDGTGFLESAVRRQVEGRNAGGVPTAVVIAAGNEYRTQRRAVLTVERGVTRGVDWRVQPADRTPGFVEIRVPEDRKLTVTVTDPLGRDVVLTLPKGSSGMVDLDAGSGPIARLYVGKEFDVQGDATGDVLVTLAIRPTQADAPGEVVAPAGAWRVTIGNPETEPLRVTVEVQRDDSPQGYPLRARPSYLDDPATDFVPDAESRDYIQPAPGSAITREGTLSPYGTVEFAVNGAPGILVVGAAMGGEDAMTGGARAAPYTGAGPTPGRGAPDLAAVAEDGFVTRGILGAGTFSGSVVAWGGTSAAVPVVARAVAEHIAENSKLPSVPDLLGNTGPVQRDPRLGEGVMPRGANGRISRRAPAP
jgi:hypothetical protein